MKIHRKYGDVDNDDKKQQSKQYNYWKCVLWLHSVLVSIAGWVQFVGSFYWIFGFGIRTCRDLVGAVPTRRLVFEEKHQAYKEGLKQEKFHNMVTTNLERRRFVPRVGIGTLGVLTAG
jgi:hypothetical protein